MIEHRNSGALGGRSAEGLGSAGSGGEVRKSVQDPHGHAAGASQKTMDKVQMTSDSLDDVIRRYIETKPYTTALIALGVGWLMGRSHHPF